MGSGFPASGADASAYASRPYRKARSATKPAVLYGALFAVLVVLAIGVEFLVHSVRAEPRDVRAIAERELQINTLEPGEVVYRVLPVFKRPAIDYFRTTHGLLVLTSKRLVYLGVVPRDLLASSDAPPTFEERTFPIDTMVHIEAGHTLLGAAHALIISTPTGTTKLGVPSLAWPKANVMMVAMEARRARALAEGVRQQQLRAIAEQERKASQAEARKPKYYTVRRGDALGSIATQWNTTPEKLQQWNHLPDFKIRVGQVLMVKPAT